MDPSCTAWCVIFLISYGFFIKGQEWTCPASSTRVFVREIQQAVLRFDVNISAPGGVTYKIWSPTGVSLLAAVYIANQLLTQLVNETYCSLVGSATVGQLYIKLTLKNTLGVYRLENTLNKTNENCITVYILGKPTLPLIDGLKNLLIGESVTVTCNSTSTTQPSNHSLAIEYDWMINGVENPEDSRFLYSSLKQTVTITNITKKDFGTQLTCSATEKVHSGYTSDSSSTVSISVIHGPDSCEDLSLLYNYTEGESVPDINCSSACYPSCVYTWASRRGVVGTTGVLSLRNISRDQAGNYSLTARNTAQSYNRSFQRSFEVVVKYPPVVTIRFSTTNRSEGSRLTLYCDGEGVPVTYVHTGLIQTVGEVEIPNNNTGLEGTDTYSSINFPSLRLQDTGNYTCKINNGIKDLNGILDQVKSAEILVEVKPKVLQTDLVFAGAAGSSVTVQIPFYCYPAVTSVKFTRYDGKEVNNGVKYNTSYSRCTVNDTYYGRRVMIPGFQAHMTITDLIEEDFVNYTLTLDNNRGATHVTVFVIAGGIPSPPRSFNYMLVYGRPKFFWEKSFNGGHPQTFIIQFSVPGSDEWKIWTTVFENDAKYKLNNTFYSTDIIGLKHGIYTARLIAENSVGSSEPVNLNASFTIAQEEDIPGKQSQTVAAAAGGAVSSLVVIIAVAVFIFVRKRKAGKNENKASHVHRNKHSKPLQKDNSDEDVEVENPVYEAAELNGQKEEKVIAKPNKKQKPLPTGADVYAVVNKRKAANKKKKGKLTAAKLSAEGDIYDNSPTKNGDTNTYGNAAFGDFALKTTDESTLETNKGNRNKDGLVYADLALEGWSKGKKPQNMCLEERTPYAQVDFQKRADPLP